MDAIRLAIQCLENSAAVKKAKKTDQDVQDAVSQLSSAATLLELSTPSRSTFTRLAELLRGRLIPLYRTSFTLTLDYSLAIFRFILPNKLLGNKQVELRRPWENVLESLFSGILDILEENPTGKLRNNVASTFYPALCPIFFFGPQGSKVELDGNLLSTIYQLLQTTVESNAKNASTLRDTSIGSTNFGWTIYYTKEFLAMESLLELFALLIPPLKTGREKRTQFIREVFDPSLFSCSDQIIHSLESISNPDWNITSTKIIEALAESDISFPQPLVVAAFALNGLRMDVSTFYVDKCKFVANIDMDGKVETLHIPFSTIRKISCSPSSNEDIRITSTSTEPPIMGDRAIQNAVEGDQTVSWNIERKLLEWFRKAIVSRGLNVELTARAKQSKTKEISLDFRTNNQEEQTPFTLKKEKVQSLSQLWNTAAPTHEDQEIATSPLAPNLELKSISKVSIAAPNEPGFLEKSRNDAVFVHPDGNLSFEPTGNVSKPSVTATKTFTPTDDVSEKDDALPSRSKIFSRKRVISISDDEQSVDLPTSNDVENLTSLSPKLEKPPPKRPKGSEVSSGPVEPVQKVKMKPQSKKIATTVDDPKEASRGDRKPTDNSKKRKFEEVDEKAPAAKKTSTPSKRQRLGSPTHLPSSPPRLLPRNRYGRSGRVSSPALPEVDFDEVPHSERNSEPKASRMKDKTGKALPKPKPVSTKKVVEKKKRPNAKDRSQKQLEFDADVTLVDTKLKDNKLVQKIVVPDQGEKDITSGKDSARAAVVEMTSKPSLKQKKDVTEGNRSRKPQKAPWESDDFLKQDLSSGGMINMEPDSKILNEDEKQPHLEEGPSDDVTATEELNHADYEETVMKLPLKSASKVVTIDLTHEDSSPVVKHPPRVAIVGSPRQKKVHVDVEQSEESVQEPPEIDVPPSPYVETNDSKYMRSASLEVFRPGHNGEASPEIGNRRENKRQLSVNFDLPDDETRLQTRDRGDKTRKSISTDHRRGREPYSRSSKTSTHRPKPKQHQIPRDVGPSSPMEKISSILTAINQAVIRNVARRFEDVSDKLDEGQRIIIEDTIQALAEMSLTSDSHLNGLMDTEAKYRGHCAKIVQRLHDYHKTTEQVNWAFKNVLSERSARTLSKQFPTKLVPNIRGPATRR